MGDLGKFIAAKGFKKLPKVQKIAQYGHTGWRAKEKSNRWKFEKQSSGQSYKQFTLVIYESQYGVFSSQVQL